MSWYNFYIPIQEIMVLRSYRYQEIANSIREQIQQGEFDGKRLPAERALMQQYGVQRNTVRQALALLEAEQWIVTRPKSGSYAVPPLPQSDNSAPQNITGTVLVVNEWNRSSTAVERILRGLSQTLEPLSISVQRFNSLPEPGRASSTLPSSEFVSANNVIGAVVWPQNPANTVALARLRASIPLVLVDRRVLGFEADYVCFDDIAGGRMATEHLLHQGHRRIGFLGDEAFAETVQHRWLGYVQALEDAGIAFDPSCTALFQGTREPVLSDYLRVFLAGGGTPLHAVVCSNDTTALSLLRHLRATRQQVPSDVAVTGYGNSLPEYLDTLELTTIEQPFEEAGRTAGKILLERLAHPARSGTGPYQYLQLPIRLVGRNSSNFTVS